MKLAASFFAAALVATSLPALAQAPTAAPPAPYAAPVAPAPPYAPPYPGYPGYPGYPPPYPGYAPTPPPPPYEMRAVDGRPPPEGYHLESRPRRGLVIAGSITFGTMYVISLSVASNSRTTGDGWLFVPVLGPFLDLSARRRCDDRAELDCFDDAGNRVLLTFDGLVQIAGAAMLFAGFAAPSHVWVRDDAPVAKREPPKPTIAFAPTTFGRSGLGLGMGGEF